MLALYSSTSNDNDMKNEFRSSVSNYIHSVYSVHESYAAPFMHIILKIKIQVLFFSLFALTEKLFKDSLMSNYGITLLFHKKYDLLSRIVRFGLIMTLVKFSF